MRSRTKIKHKHVTTPFQIMVGDLLTGHMGDPMHRELYQLKQAKSRKLRK